MKMAKQTMLTWDRIWNDVKLLESFECTEIIDGTCATCMYKCIDRMNEWKIVGVGIHIVRIAHHLSVSFMT